MNKPELVQALRQLGVTPGRSLMVHASLSSLGVMQGGAEAVVDGLREVVGDEGALIIPSFRGSIRSDRYALRECREHCPQDFCPSREPGDTGIVGETVRQQADAVRSCHPTHSWVGLGRAEGLLRGHRNSPTPCGADSPFHHLMALDGSVLLLGVGVEALTNIHVVEEARNVPYVSAIDPERRHATYTTSGRRLQYVFPALLQAALAQTGLLTSKRIGCGVSHLISARDLGSWLWVITAKDPWCLVLRPSRTEYRPFEDACRKVAAMDRAWSAGLDREAWRRLLQAAGEVREPARFIPTAHPATDCPAYRGILRGHSRCAANEIAPWERFEDFSPLEPGVATCDHCDWPTKAQRREPKNET